MDILFKNKITDYKYAFCCDLAQWESGFSLIDIHDNKVIGTYQLSLSRQSVLPEVDWYVGFGEMVDTVFQEIDLSTVVFIKEKMPSNCGPFSTAATLQNLAKIHAAFNIFISLHNYSYYSDGIHAVTVKALFRALLNLEKPTKEDIKSKVCSIYNLETTITSDQSDSIALWIAMREKKYNQDICDHIKEVKRHKKTLKNAKAIADCDKEMQRLEELLWEGAPFITTT